MKQRNQGITLIALIITIIIMLILVGVSIQLVINSGLFITAKNAAIKTEEAYRNEANLGEKVTIDGKEYNSVDEYTDYINGVDKTVDWDTILADATANPNNYKHPEQSSTNGDIGIGTDGKPVNLDLWTYEVINENEIKLSKSIGTGGIPGYQNSNIVDGKIIGIVPQYIKINGNSEFYETTSMDGAFLECSSLSTAPEIPNSVTSMDSTFWNCRSLTTVPEIPNSVTNMSWTFSNCTSLITAPAIPNSVTSMENTFYGCSKLQGTIEINANPTSYWYCFLGAATEGTGLVVTGSSTMLDTLIGTKSDTSNITKGT